LYFISTFSFIFRTIILCTKTNYTLYVYLSSSMTYHRICNKSSTTGAHSRTGTATLPEHLNSSPIFLFFFGGVRVDQSYLFYVVFYQRFILLVFAIFSLWPLHCLFVFELHLLISSLVSSNFSFWLKSEPNIPNKTTES